MADDQVPFMNSVLARDTFIARMAPAFAAQDVNPAADHGGCVVPALTQTVLFFLNYREIFYLVNTQSANTFKPLNIQPNPASDQIRLSHPESDGYLEIRNLDGKRVFSADMKAGQPLTVSVRNLSPGQYVVHFSSQQQYRTDRILIIAR
jgi:hypothetical protein